MNVAILKKLTAIISAGIVALSTTVPVFASGQSVGPIDRDVLSSIDFGGQLYLGQASHLLAAGSNELSVPIFYKITGLSTTYSQMYLSGLIDIVVGLNTFGIDSNSPTNVNPSYFEPVENDTIRISWTTSYGLRIYLDNYRNENNANVDTGILIGYMHYTYNEMANGYTYTFPVANRAVSPSNKTVVYSTAYEYGFVEAITYAISTAQSTQDALQWLTYIEQDTRYLPDIYNLLYTQYPLVLQALATIDQHVLQIYYQLAQMNAAQSSQAAEIAGEVEQKASQSAVLSNDMAVDKPQLSGDDVNITGLIDTSVNNQFTGFLGALVQNNFITTMFLIALSCMIIGFVLYGKK